MSKKRIVLIDDHPIFLQGLKIIIESYKTYKVIGEAGNIRDSLKLIQDKKPDLAIVDLNLGEEDGLDLVKRLHKDFPELAIVVLSMLDERHYAERAISSGARGYLMKEETAEVLHEAMDCVIEGKVWMSNGQKERYLDNLFASGGISKSSTPQTFTQKLTNRQLMILSYMGKGYGTRQIAEALGLSPKTVEAHKHQLKKRLDCKNAQELLQFAIQWIQHT